MIAAHEVESVVVACPGCGPERWAPIPGVPDCFISSHGRLRRGSGILRTYLNRPIRGYFHRAVRVGGRAYPVYVHSAVLLAFVGPRPPGMMAAHEDGNSHHNCLANLSWKTGTENQLDRRRHGTRPEHYRKRPYAKPAVQSLPSTPKTQETP